MKEPPERDPVLGRRLIVQIRCQTQALARRAKKLEAVVIASLAQPVLKLLARTVFGFMIAGVLIPVFFIHGTHLNRGVLPDFEAALALSGFIVVAAWLAARYQAGHPTAEPPDSPGWPEGGAPPRLLVPPQIMLEGAPRRSPLRATGEIATFPTSKWSGLGRN